MSAARVVARQHGVDHVAEISGEFPVHRAVGQALADDLDVEALGNGFNHDAAHGIVGSQCQSTGVPIDGEGFIRSPG